jgi:hypothetical protein
VAAFHRVVPEEHLAAGLEPDDKVVALGGDRALQVLLELRQAVDAEQALCAAAFPALDRDVPRLPGDPEESQWGSLRDPLVLALDHQPGGHQGAFRAPDQAGVGHELLGARVRGFEDETAGGRVQRRGRAAYAVRNSRTAFRMSWC